MSCRKTGPTSMGYLWTNLKQWKICECGNLWKSMSTFHHCLSDRFLYTGRQSGAPHLFCPALWPLSPLASFTLFSGCNLLNSKTKYRNMMHFRRRGTWPGGSRETITELNLLSNGAVESFWDTLWLGIQAFLYFMEESRRTLHRCLQAIENSICYRTVPSRASGTPCGSVLKRFCV